MSVCSAWWRRYCIFFFFAKEKLLNCLPLDHHALPTLGPTFLCLSHFSRPFFFHSTCFESKHKYFLHIRGSSPRRAPGLDIASASSSTETPRHFASTPSAICEKFHKRSTCATSLLQQRGGSKGPQSKNRPNRNLAWRSCEFW